MERHAPTCPEILSCTFVRKCCSSFSPAFHRLDSKSCGFGSTRKFFVLCTSVELRRYRVDGLLDGYKARGVVTHHHPVHEGMAPDIASCLAMLDELRGCLEDGKCMVIQ
uniref:protein-tyrosine-phosphatase n=1 Tax=Eptatretus burgeri TaxID=7764 RepID=A0A8C4NKX5_EPTBU